MSGAASWRRRPPRCVRMRKKRRKRLPARSRAPAVSITPEQVMQAIHEELCDAQTYRCLAARMSGCARKTLLAISHDERCHAKKLGAIYFLLTGKKACQKKPENPCITCNAETLRRQYQRELSAREHYEALGPHVRRRGLARCANLRSTSAATRRASTSCCKAVSETETRRLPRW